MTEETKDSTIIGPAGLFRLVQDRLKPWKTPNGDVFVDLWVDARRYTVAVRSEGFVGMLYLICAQDAPGKMLSARAVDEIRAWAIGIAIARGRTFDANVRLGGDSKTVWYDLGDDTHDMVKWIGGRWVITRATGDTPHFYRPGGMLGQVRPGDGGNLVELLSRHIRTKNDDIYLIAAWLIGAMKPGGPYPILIINGEQGSAKSTTTRLLRKIIDPHALDMREPLDNNRDLVAAVKNSFVLAFDNMSFLKGNLSDSFCRISTGTGALGGRALYTDTTEAAFTACRPIVLNGIPAFAEREDLISRSINLELPSIKEGMRLDDDTFWASVDQDLPNILGALFDCVAVAQARFPQVKLNNAPRMANFARWAYAGLGDEGDRFLQAYSRNKMEASSHFIEHSEVAQAIIKFMEDKELWHGTWAQLLKDLGQNPLSKNWPTNSLQLRNRVIRLSEDLRKNGIEWRTNGREGGTGRMALELRRLQNYLKDVFQVSAA